MNMKIKQFSKNIVLLQSKIVKENMILEGMTLNKQKIL